MLITVNGKTKELQNTLTIGQYLEENSYVPSQIAVELNERILSKAEYSTTVLHENDIALGEGPEIKSMEPSNLARHERNKH